MSDQSDTLRRLRIIAARLLWMLWLPNVIEHVRAGWQLFEYDTGTKVEAPLPPGFFTYPSGPIERYRHDFSHVDVETLTDIHDWLRGCEYDYERSGGADRSWMLPSDFEATRRGVCRDFAIWTWRKLAELDYIPRLVIGRGSRAEMPDGESRDEEPTAGHPWPIDHAWIHLDRDGTTYLYETTRQSSHLFLMTLEAAAHAGYRPCYGVDTHLRTYMYRERWDFDHFDR
ncbi:MAG: transglutaminase-like domain-containing protein [Bradymonadaceae bacterium]